MLKKSLFVVFAVALCSLGLQYPETGTASEGIAEDGTYTGKAEGRNGPVEVKVTVSKGMISNVSVWHHHETPVITREAIEDFPRQIVKTGHVGVDAVAGATETCDAIREAVADCLKQAGGDPINYGYLDPEKSLLEQGSRKNN